MWPFEAAQPVPAQPQPQAGDACGFLGLAYSLVAAGAGAGAGGAAAAGIRSAGVAYSLPAAGLRTLWQVGCRLPNLVWTIRRFSGFADSVASSVQAMEGSLDRFVFVGGQVVSIFLWDAAQRHRFSTCDYPYHTFA